jgi:copper chaperone
MTTYRLTINGMTCDHCTRAVRSALEALPEVTPTEVGIGTALIATDGSDAALAHVRQAVEKAGYTLLMTIPVEQ